MLSLGLNLLGIGKHVLGWVSGAFKWLFAKWYRVALLVSLTAFLWAFTGWTFADRRADKNEAKYKAEAAAHIGTKVAYKNAQAIAADMYRRKVAEYEERERNHAITTDKTIRNNVNLALAGLRARQAAQSAAGRAGTTQAPTPASDTSGTGGVSIVDAGNAGNEDDVRICTENTVKLIGAREYLLTLPE